MAGRFPHHYSFRSEWDLGASASEVFDVLADLGSYPAWWPQVRSIRQVAEDAAELVCRSVLPYDLVFRASHERKDKAAGELRARLTGDLDGYAGWTIEPRGHGTRLVFTQGVEVTKPLLRRLGLIARPALLVNHELMMRQGRRGLRTLLAPPS